jgi:hypothetical protein
MARRSFRGCGPLVFVLILLLLLFPALAEMARPLLFVAIIASVFVLGVVLVRPGRARVRNAVALACGQIGVTTVGIALEPDSIPYLVTVALALGVTAVLIGYCVYCVLRYVLQANYISRDQIYAGISVYLMLGFAFGCIYYLISILDPGCFAINSSTLEGKRDVDLMYFSFVTLATLGYGDITPAAKASRVLAELEAVAGTLYMAVFMARLVSLAGAAPATAIVDSGLAPRENVAAEKPQSDGASRQRV